jgi:hypothetical protein
LEMNELDWSRVLLLKVWSMDQHWHHLEDY